MQIEVHGRNLPVTPPCASTWGSGSSGSTGCSRASARATSSWLVERNPRIADSQIAEATLLTRGHVVRARSTATDMYAAIDGLADRVRRQVADISERASYGRPPPAARARAAEDGATSRKIVADLGLDGDGLASRPPRITRSAARPYARSASSRCSIGVSSSFVWLMPVEDEEKIITVGTPARHLGGVVQRAARDRRVLAARA